MQALDLILNKRLFFLIGIFVVFMMGITRIGFSENEEVMHPLKNKGLQLIEKEMIRLSDSSQKKWTFQEKNNYRAFLFLEDYFLHDGITPWAMKVMHRLVKMRDNTDNLQKKAFLDCEAWRVLDHDLKNYENAKLIGQLMEKRKFTKADHRRFRKITGLKVGSCIQFVSTQWTWNGPAYQDLLYDIKTRNTVESVQTYVKVKSSQ